MSVIANIPYLRDAVARARAAAWVDAAAAAPVPGLHPLRDRDSVSSSYELIVFLTIFLVDVYLKILQYEFIYICMVVTVCVFSLYSKVNKQPLHNYQGDYSFMLTFF